MNHLTSRNMRVELANWVESMIELDKWDLLDTESMNFVAHFPEYSQLTNEFAGLAEEGASDWLILEAEKDSAQFAAIQIYLDEMMSNTN